MPRQTFATTHSRLISLAKLIVAWKKLHSKFLSLAIAIKCHKKAYIGIWHLLKNFNNHCYYGCIFVFSDDNLSIRFDFSEGNNSFDCYCLFQCKLGILNKWKRSSNLLHQISIQFNFNFKITKKKYKWPLSGNVRTM